MILVEGGGRDGVLPQCAKVRRWGWKIERVDDRPWNRVVILNKQETKEKGRREKREREERKNTLSK